MTEMTYGRMEEVLQALGFILRGVEEKNKVFIHEATGALVVYPEFPSEKLVLPRHLLAVKSILQAMALRTARDSRRNCRRQVDSAREISIHAWKLVAFGRH